MMRAALAVVTLAVVTGIATGSARAAPTHLRTDPPGASLVLEGPVRVAASGTLPLDGMPPGVYRLALRGEGLPEVRGRLWLRGDGGLEVGGYRGPGSILAPPGWLRLRDGNRTGGVLHLSAGVLSAALAALAEKDRHDADRDLDEARERYREAVGEEALRQARLDVLQAHLRRHDAAEMRDVWLAGLGVLWVGAALEQWIFPPSAELETGTGAEAVVRAGPASRGGAALRSFLVPGAGQRYLGRSGRGDAFSAAMMVLGAAGAILHDTYLDRRRDQETAQERYRLASTAEEARRWRARVERAADGAHDRERWQWLALGAAAAVHVWNVIDAYRLAPGGEGNRAWTGDVEIRPDGLRAAVTWRIP